jgi:hypothetical protein
MKDSGRFFWLLVGIVLGSLAVGAWCMRPSTALAGNDRHEDYIICTGPATINPRTQTDGVWLLDYRTGKLLATLIDRSSGKISGWADLDLLGEFGLAPRANVHFLMTTGQVAHGQAALYVAETTTGKMGVYTLGQRQDGQPGLAIRRHDMVPFRQPQGE